MESVNYNKPAEMADIGKQIVSLNNTSITIVRVAVWPMRTLGWPVFLIA